MTYAEFAATVCAFANRTSADLTVNGTDLVLRCANMAKAYAQRKHNFKMARGRAFLSVSIDGTELSTAKDGPSGSAVVVKKVEAGWFYVTDGSNYRKSSRIPFITLGDTKNFYDVNNTDWSPSLADAASIPSETRILIQGTKIYLLSQSTAQPIMLDCILQVPDYAGATPTVDFFLTYHADWLIAKTLDLLNIYMKEDNRVMISQGKLNDAWESVIAQDEDFADGQNDIDAGD